ncbi:MAG TPA: MFS transporter [Kofleriaceae bacterium]|nr:MFS transporter [Kofleriaceae bacterium]
MTSGTASLTFLDRLLRPFSKVRPGEGVIAALMLVCVFLILTSYYVMKTAREGLILSGGTWGLRGDELKTYANGAMALLLVGVVPAYGMLANRTRRIRLINVCYAIVIASLLAFFVLGRAGVPIGLAFFVWLGLVSVFLIAQFWSYANDLYTEEQGKRLFAIIATGGSLGAIFGPRIAKLANTFTLLLVAALILGASIALFNVIEHVNNRHGRDHRSVEPITGAGGFALVLRDRYLLLIACLLLVANLVNTTGEYVLSNAAREHAMELVPARIGVDASVINAERRELIKAFYSDFFYWVNVTSFLIQAFLVSRIIDKLGVRRALFALPLIAFGAYAMIGTVGGLMLVRTAKIAENGTDYSLQNTVRQALFLPTDRVVKYKAKAAIDTFFVRAGDTLSAVLVGIGIHELAFTGRDLALVNLILITVWLAIAGGIARRHRLISRESEPPPPPVLHPLPGAHA